LRTGHRGQSLAASYNRTVIPDAPRPLLAVVVPVYNGGPDVVANVETIRDAVVGPLAPERVEVVVVSDGSIDGTAERLLEARADGGIRVIHYDRNLGKGYAVKLGALATTASWVATVDGDLDLDPSAVPMFLETARREGLDLAIGSKRHPHSVVDYPRSRRGMSWAYQQLNRVLFGLDVRDTQVGLKLFRRDVVDDVFPLLLVKRFAIDLELLVVAKALGYDAMRELPVRLGYRFSGSGVGWVAVARALVDTAAIFYRLRILRTYGRKRRFLSAGTMRVQPLVTIAAEPAIVTTLDYPSLERCDPGPVEEVVAGARGQLVALLEPGARPAGNWISAAVPYFTAPAVAAVVVPEVAPPSGSTRVRTAAAVRESRLGAGSRRSRYFPGNVRTVADHESGTVVVARTELAEAVAAGVGGAELVSWLAARGGITVSTPDTLVVAPAPAVFVPHLRSTLAAGTRRGRRAWETRGRSMTGHTAASVAPAAAAVVGAALATLGTGRARDVGLALVAVYAAAVAGVAGVAGIRFRSPAVAALTAPALVLTQAAYVGGFIAGLARAGRAHISSIDRVTNPRAN
jgi:glycosyltransferase involved in cell wall biosynthesis